MRNDARRKPLVAAFSAADFLVNARRGEKSVLTEARGMKIDKPELNAFISVVFVNFGGGYQINFTADTGEEFRERYLECDYPERVFFLRYLKSSVFPVFEGAL